MANKLNEEWAHQQAVWNSPTLHPVVHKKSYYWLQLSKPKRLELLNHFKVMIQTPNNGYHAVKNIGD